MNHTSARRLAGLVLSCAAAFAASSAPAHAASATITGDDGNPVALTAGMTLRHLAPDVTLAFSPEEKSYAAKIVGPGGAISSGGDDCRDSDFASPERLAYQGNGTYTLVLRVGSNSETCEGATPQSVAFVINAGVTIRPPARQPLLMREQQSSSSIQYAVPVDLNPGASSYEFRYAAGATVGPDGGIAGTSQTAFVDTSAGTASVSFPRPGRYTFVVRAKSSRTDTTTAWSPRVDVTVVAPFDLVQPRLSDSRGPVYKVAGRVAERTATGKVTIALGKGRNPKRFKRLGSARIRRGGRFSLRFRLAGTGNYVMRFSYRGNKTVLRGSEKYPIRFFSIG